MLWLRYMEFCGSYGPRRCQKVMAKALQLFPGLWMYAAAWEFEHNLNVEAARALMLEGIRACLQAQSLWHEYFWMELTYGQKLKARRLVLGLDSDSGVKTDQALALTVDCTGAAKGFDLADAERIENDIGESLEKDFPTDEGNLDLKARGHLRSSAKLGFDESLQRAGKVYEDALKSVPTVRMYELYIRSLHKFKICWIMRMWVIWPVMGLLQVREDVRLLSGRYIFTKQQQKGASLLGSSLMSTLPFCLGGQARGGLGFRVVACTTVNGAEKAPVDIHRKGQSLKPFLSPLKSVPFGEAKPIWQTKVFSLCLLRLLHLDDQRPLLMRELPLHRLLLRPQVFNTSSMWLCCCAGEFLNGYLVTLAQNDPCDICRVMSKRASLHASSSRGRLKKRSCLF